MKRKLFLFCIVAAILAAAFCLLPELAGSTFGTHPDGLLLATGPAFAALKWPVGRNNMGGFKGYLIFVPADAPSAMPEVPAWDEAADNEELVTASGTFTFPAEGTIKSPLYLYSTDATVGYNAEAQGEADGISYRQTLTAFFPGNMKEAHAFAALVKNTPGYYIFEDSDGQQMMIGQKGMPASTSVAFAGGQARADRRGHTFTITADSNYSAIFLETPLDVEAVKNGTWASAGAGG